MNRSRLIFMAFGWMALGAVPSVFPAAPSGDFAPGNILSAANASEPAEKQENSRQGAGPSWCKPLTVRGKLSKGRHQHHNGSWFAIFVLALEKPLSLPAEAREGEDVTEMAGIQDVQIKEDEAVLDGMVGKNVEVYGEMSPWLFAYDVRPVIFTNTKITEISKPGSKIVTAAQVNGTWESGPGTFKVLALGNQRLKVEFSGFYEFQTPSGPMARDPSKLTEEFRKAAKKAERVP